MTGATGQQSTFRAGLIQMRSGRSPQANLDAAAKLIGEAKAGGADYVLTPEMTNVMESSRQKLLTAIVAEESDASLATFRELARNLSIWLHIGSLAVKVTPDKAANRAFLIDPRGEIVARYDKIHMFDVDLANGESYRESNNFRAGELAVVHDLPWGRLGVTVCYDLRFPALYRALAEAGASFLAIPSAFTKQTGEAHWHVLNARPRDRERLVRAGGRAGRRARERPRDVRTFAGGRSLGPHPRRGRHRARRRAGGHRSSRSSGGARACAVPATWPPLRDDRAASRADASTRRAEPGMIRYSLQCERRHEFEIWFKNSADYDSQSKRGLVTCPSCSSSKVEKTLMAPSLGRGARKGAKAATPEVPPSEAPPPGAPSPAAGEDRTPVAMMSPQEREFRTKLKELRDHLTKNADNVGGKFPEEARKMHYGEIEHRSIYGEASPKEAKELAEEGIEFHPLPILPDERN